VPCAKVGHGQSVRRRDDCSSWLTCNVPADPHRRMCARRYLRGQSVKVGGTCASLSPPLFSSSSFRKTRAGVTALIRHRKLASHSLHALLRAATLAPLHGTAPSSSYPGALRNRIEELHLFVGVGNEPGLEIFATADRVWLHVARCSLACLHYTLLSLFCHLRVR
jgi:hypothetical protein